MAKALSVNPDIGLQELLQVSNSEQWSVQYSPFLLGPGGQLGGTIIRRAAPWKGLTKGDNENMSQYLDRLGDVNADVASGLEDAQSMLDNVDQQNGVALIEQEGQMKIVSQTAANLAQAGSTPTSVIADNLASYSEALDQLVARGGQAALPTVS